MKKIFIFLIGTISTILADECCPCYKAPDPIPNCICQPTYNLSAMPQINCMKDFYVDASFIYWQPIEQGLEIAVDSGSATSQGKVYFVDMDFSPGFKIGLGGFLNKMDSWDIYAEYTWIRSDDKRTIKGCSCLQFSWIPSSGLYFNQADSVESKFKLDFQSGELLLGRIAYFGNHLLLKPVFGPKFLYIKQRFNDIANNVIASGNQEVPTTVDKYFVNINSHSWIIGAKVGLETEWLLNCHVKFFAKLGQGLLYQKSDTKGQFSHVGGNIPDAFDMNAKNEKSYIIYNSDLFTGIGYSSYFYHDNYFVNINLGYEFDIYFNENSIGEIQNDLPSVHKENGYLAFQGLKINLRLSF